MKPTVVKIGGSTLGSHDTAIADIAAADASGRRLVVVHGGGNTGTQWLKVHGVASEFVDGLRVTGPDAIEVVAAVFAGLVNKQLVGQLLAAGARAFGLSGVDGGLLATKQLDERLGYVGEVTKMDRAVLDGLLSAGFLPVVAPVAYLQSAPSQLMNVNADTVAGEVAASIGASALVFLTDVPGVKDADGTALTKLTADEAASLIERGVAGGGMAPKLAACITAARAGVSACIVDGREPHALRAVLDGAAIGTTIAA
ncbi:MAG TPA: acetylglutamate kinase [Dehalococcoidia bacterium]|jgi:acetylglutamate kinase